MRWATSPSPLFGIILLKKFGPNVLETRYRVGAVRRIRPYGFANQPGNGLDDFESESSAARSSAVVRMDASLANAPAPRADVTDPTDRDQSSGTSALLVVVGAYPEPELLPPALSSLRSAGGPSSVPRHVVASALRAVRAAAFAPVLFVAWCALRVWRLAWWMGDRTWPLVAGAVGLASAGIGAGVHAVVASVAFVGRSIAAGLPAGVNAVVGGVASFRRAIVSVGRTIAVAGAAVVAFAHAVAIAGWNGLVPAMHLVAAGLRAGVNAVAARVAPLGRTLVSRGRTVAAAAAEIAASGRAAAIAFQPAASRTRQALALRLAAAGHAAIAGARSIGAAAVENTRRRTPGAIAFLRASITSARAAVASFGRTLAYAIQRAAVRAGAHSRVALGASVRALHLAGTRVAATAALVGHALAERARSVAESLRPVPVLATGAAAESDFTPVARRALDNRGHWPARLASVKVALAGGPEWVRQLRTGPARAAAVILVLGVSSSALVLLLSLRPAPPAATLAASGRRPEAAAVVRPSPIAAGVSSVVRPAVPAVPKATRAPSDRGRSETASVPRQDTAPARSLSPARVRAIWAKSDTRSLDRALGSLRSATLAFHRCDLQLTSADRAVAHCDESLGDAETSPQLVAWKIDFRRFDEGWFIEDLSTSVPRRGARPNR